MRMLFALAATLVLCANAGAQSVAAQCAAEADARGLHGRERVRLESGCKTARMATMRKSAPAGVKDVGWERPHDFCVHPVDSTANVLIGACVPCVLIASLVEAGGHCDGPQTH